MSETLFVNSNISHYRILEKLGAGGMGEVFLAEDTRLDRRAALKILPADLAQDPDRMRRFVQEAKATSALNHPNIITIYEIGSEGDANFIAAEYIEGETLRERLKENSFSFDECLEVGIQIASALQAAHSVNIVHRDIKPDNIMIRPDGFVKILDFGIAKLTEKKAEVLDAEAATAIQAQTALGMIIGTAAYMSPEQAQGKAVDARSDIFSFGAVLYEILAGCQPFAGETAMDAIGRILHKEPTPLNQLSPEIPPELERIINKALCKDCKERYQTAKDLLIDLKELKEELSFQSKLKRTSQPNKETEAQTQIIKAVTDENRRTTGETTYANSIAVLPFANMSADAENEYFCDGLAEELLNALAKIEDLKVAARTSAFSFKGKNTNISEIGQALNVKTILEGSVRRAGNQVRITVQLVNAADGYHLWSERYDREMKGIFDLQDEITLAVVDALKLRLLGDEKMAVLKRGTDNTEAYEFYLKGRYFWNKRTLEGFNKGVEFFQQSINLDPNYALAFVGLADCYILMGTYAGKPAGEVMPLARAAAERALQIDDQLAEAHASMAHVYWRSLEWERAEAEFQHAISLNPNYATAHQFYSEYLRALRRFDEELREIKRAQEIEPLSHIIGTLAGEAFHNLGNADAATGEWKRVIELEPNFPLTHFFLGNAYVSQRRYEEAIVTAQKAVDLSNRWNLTLGGLGYAYGMSHKRAEALAVIKELEEKHAQREATGFDLAYVYAGLKDNDEAINWLKRDFETGNTSLLIYIAYNPLYEQLSGDPRYQNLLWRMGFPADVIPRHKTASETKTELINAETGNSIAVLPFADMSADADNEYFCDGLAEELLNALAKIDELKVAARTSAFSFKNKNVEVSEIGNALNVKTVLEGSVRKSGNRLRITVQLINAADGYHLWSERYDREMQDIFDVQDEITLAVVDALKLKLLGEEKRDVLKRYTDNTQAYELYLKGLYHHNKHTPEEWLKALEYFEKAIEIEPEYAPAFAGIGISCVTLHIFGVLAPDEVIPKWKAATSRALAIDDRLAEGHLSQAALHFYYDWDWTKADREFKRAIELNANSAITRFFYGLFLSTREQAEEGIKEGRRALELDPLSFQGNGICGWIYMFADRQKDALAQVERLKELEPNFHVSYWLAGAAHLANREYVRAVDELQKSVALAADQIVLSTLGSAYGLAGKREEALETLHQLLAIRERRYATAFNIARVYAGLGMPDEAFEWLDKAVEERNGEMVYLDRLTTIGMRAGWGKNIRTDPRYQEILRRANLTSDKQIQSKFTNEASEAQTAMLSPVVTNDEEIPATVSKSDEHSSPDKPKTKPKWWLFGLLGLIILTSALFAYRYFTPTSKQIESIAVLPFINESGNADTEYLSDGMTETLISSLSQLPNLNVKARSSVFRYKGKETDAQTVGKELNVQAILNGRVVQRGQDLTLYVELVDAETENVLWKSDYNRQMTNLVSLQTEIARDVSQKLKTKLSGADEQRLAKNYTENAEAYQLYLKGRFYWNKRAPEDIKKSIEYFRQAITLDPNYALAYAGLSDAYSIGSYYGVAPPREAMPKAKEAALKALSLDDQLSEAHAALALIMTDYDYDFAGAERECKRAIELNPNNATANLFCGVLLYRLGRFEESFAQFKRALELEPLSLPINRQYGEALFFARRYDEAITQLKKTAELDSNHPFTYFTLANVYRMKGNYAESVEEFAKAQERFHPRSAANAPVVRESFARGGWEGFLREMTGEQTPSKFPRYFYATWYAALGEKDKAIVELEKTYENRNVAISQIKVDPRLDPLRADPRFEELLRKVGFPE